MKLISQKMTSIVAGLLLLLATLIPMTAQASGGGTATLSLSPASGSYTTGGTISVGIYEDSGSDSVNAVQANLTYNSSLLSCSSSSIQNSSAFGIAAQSSCGSGTVQIARGTITPVTGSQLVATINFTASAAGTAAINYAGGSAVVRSSDNGNETLTTVGASYAISAPAVTPPPSTSGSGTTSSSTPKTTPKSSTPTPTSSQPAATSSTPAAPFTISNIKVTNLSDKTATVTWQTSAAASSEVDYGTSTSYGLSVVDNNLVTNHYVVIDPDTLKASSTYHFLVKSYNASHQLVTSQDTVFATMAGLAVPAPSFNLAAWATVSAAFLILVVIAFLLKKGSILHLHHHTPGSPPTTYTGISGGTNGTIVTPGGSGPSALPIVTTQEADLQPDTNVSTTSIDE